MTGRICDACKHPIAGTRCLELGAKLLCTDEDSDQDPLEQVYGEYCATCIRSGQALADLMTGFTKYPQKLKLKGARS